MDVNNTLDPAPLFSVVMTQYHPDKEQLKHTLDSILMQDLQGFELIIADDGSPQDWFAETKQYLARHGFTDVKFCKNKTNRGTVINWLNGIEAARGEWIVGINPGDYFYDRTALRRMAEIMQNDAPDAFFGVAAYYCTGPDGAFRLCPGAAPMDRSCYDPARYDAGRIKRNLLLYSDHISGATMTCRREVWLRALRQMAGRVKFAEDFATLLFAVEGTRMRPYNDLVRWYEYGTGISTDKNTASEQRLQNDLKAMILLLREKYPHDRTVWLAYQYFFNDRHRSRLLRGLIGRTIVPQWLPFKRAQRSWRPPTNGALQKLLDLYNYNKEETL